MKKILTVMIMSIIVGCVSCNSTQNNSNKVTQQINDNWVFKQVDEQNWLEAEVPGCVHTDLMANKIIEDPYYRLNEKSVQWIDKKDWQYKTTFTASDSVLSKTKILLHFKGLDTYASVKLNGEEILEADNMFREWKVDVKDILQKENTLEVYFKSPTKNALLKLQANGYPLPAVNDQSENGEMGDDKVSTFIRKAPYHFGWDWGPRMVTSGIWRPIELVAWNAPVIENAFINTKSISENAAQLQATVQFTDDMATGAQIIVKANHTTLITKTIDTELNQIALDFELQNPALWYPNGLGEQNMVDFEIIVKNKNEVSDTWRKKIGIRTARVIREKDEKGESFLFEINGQRVFAKGANYIPNDIFIPRVADSTYEHIIKSAADANMNMIRVWGGGIYENEIFYSLCDKYGLMVWQDFMYACSMYPGDESFLQNIKIEAEQNVIRLRNHPSIVLWCGNNEMEVAWSHEKENSGWGWKELYNDFQRQEIWNSYDTVFHHILPDVVKHLDPNTSYWPSSPSAGDGEISNYESTSGDMHYWGVWHGEHPFSDFKKYVGRFMSEYGFQSFPEFKSVQKYTLPEDYDIESEVMASHQRSGIGNLRIRSYMEDHYKIPSKFEDLLYVGQLLQAEGIKMAIDQHRAAMPYCMGTLYWQLNDCWPVASWAGMDYYGQWKALHYFVKEANKEVSLAATVNDNRMDLHLISDSPESKTVTITMEVMDFSGRVKKTDQFEQVIDYGQSYEILNKKIATYLGSSDMKNHLVKFVATSDDEWLDTEILYLTPIKELELPEADVVINISEKKDHFMIELKSDQLAKNVFLSLHDVDDAYHRFSDNYFDLLPSETKTILYPKSIELNKFKDSLTLKHLMQTY